MDNDAKAKLEQLAELAGKVRCGHKACKALVKAVKKMASKQKDDSVPEVE